jgi:hypothetical protein
MASVEQASAITASSGYKIRYQTHFNLKKEVYFPDNARLFGRNQRVSLAKMAAINQVTAKADKPARRNRLICCVAVGKSKRYSSNLVDLDGCPFDPLLEDGTVVRVPLRKSQEPKSPYPSFSKRGDL